jgi:hypothetical protein
MDVLTLVATRPTTRFPPCLARIELLLSSNHIWSTSGMLPTYVCVHACRGGVLPAHRHAHSGRATNHAHKNRVCQLCVFGWASSCERRCTHGWPKTSHLRSLPDERGNAIYARLTLSHHHLKQTLMNSQLTGSCKGCVQTQLPHPNKLLM